MDVISEVQVLIRSVTINHVKQKYVVHAGNSSILSYLWYTLALFDVPNDAGALVFIVFVSPLRTQYLL